MQKTVKINVQIYEQKQLINVLKHKYNNLFIKKPIYPSNKIF